MKIYRQLLLLFLAPAVFAAAPVITQQPIHQTIFIGDPATFRVLATGSAPLAYQWLRNGVSLAAATTNAYSLPSVSSNDDGAAFSVKVSNGEGAVTSLVAVLTVDFGVPGPATVVPLLSYNSSWKYNETENLDGVNWVASNFNDSSWPTGSGLLAAESNSEIADGAKSGAGHLLVVHVRTVFKPAVLRWCAQGHGTSTAEGGGSTSWHGRVVRVQTHEEGAVLRWQPQQTLILKTRPSA